ncbi:hypothetical protein BDQ17DRAFT_512611 [Cyathus striatus]|nr:hypothetical protein BDQ17DRAFT_512611 [Cyathus striatus]
MSSALNNLTRIKVLARRLLYASDLPDLVHHHQPAHLDAHCATTRAPRPIREVLAQALVDHFFMDVEDRIRDIYQPLPPDKLANKKYYTHRSDFYVNPNETLEVVVKGKSLRVRAPDRVISRQMKIFKEQWAGMGMSMDIALVQSDQDMAAAIWRNILGARGAQGIAYAADASNSEFRRQINLVGGEVVKVSKLQIEAEETKDDGSGVHDFLRRRLISTSSTRDSCLTLWRMFDARYTTSSMLMIRLLRAMV